MVLHKTATQPPPDIVPKIRYCQLRNGVWQFRLRVPGDLKDDVGNKGEIFFSLETSDSREAEILGSEAAAKYKRQFKELRSKKTGDQQPKTREKFLRILSREQAVELARRWLIRAESAEEESQEAERAAIQNFEGVDPKSDEDDEILADISYRIAAITQEAPNWVAPTDYDDGRKFVDAYLAEEGFTVDKDSYELLRKALQKARVENLKRSSNRVARKEFQVHDQMFDNVTAYTPQTAGRRLVTISEFSQMYFAEHERVSALKTLAACKVHLRFLGDLLGANTPIQDIKREQAQFVGDALYKLPSNATKKYRGQSPLDLIKQSFPKSERLASNSRRNYFANIFAAFEYAVSTHLLDSNPFNDRWFKQRFFEKQPHKEEESEVICYTSDDLKKVFATPLYTGCKNDGRGFSIPGPNVPRRARFWVPLIGLFQGFREHEICQLNTNDLRKEEGIWVFAIRVSEENRFKNAPTVRVTPFHPELHKLGFLDYIEERQKDIKSNKFFPEITPGSLGSYSDHFSKWYARFIRKIFPSEPRPNFHSFRHTFRDALRRAGVIEERVSMLGGWSRQGQQAKYGRSKILPELAEEIAKVQFPELDLSHLYIQK